MTDAALLSNLALAARFFLFVRENPRGSNKGRWVEALQRLGNTDAGEPWCLCYVVAVLDMAYAGRSPAPPVASCEVLHTWATSNGYASSTPHPGDVFLVRNDQGIAHHAGLVLSVTDDLKTIHEISGNTNTDGSREGYGVFERDRLVTPLLLFVTLPNLPTLPT